MQTQHLGPLEQKILKVLWKTPDQTISQIQHALNAAATPHPLAYTTVLTVTRRLCFKEIITSRKVGRSFVFSAKEDRRSFVRNLVHSTITALTDRFGEQAVSAFIEEAHTLSKTERAHSIQSLQTKPKPKKKR